MKCSLSELPYFVQSVPIREIFAKQTESIHVTALLFQPSSVVGSTTHGQVLLLAYLQCSETDSIRHGSVEQIRGVGPRPWGSVSDISDSMDRS